MSQPNVWISSTEGASPFLRSVDNIQPVPLVAGEQIWRLIRGNAGPATPAQIAAEASDVMAWSLNHGRGGAPWELISSGDNQWTIGEARPLLVEQISHERGDVPLPKGKVLARREEFPDDGLPSVIGSTDAPPWFVRVSFWWRGKPTAASWPCVGFGTTQPELTRLGWTLDTALVPDVKRPDPGDHGWLAAKVHSGVDPIVDRAKKNLGDFGAGVAKVAAVVGGGVLAWEIYKSTRG